MRSNVRSEPDQATSSEIIEIVARHYGLEVSEIQSRGQHRHLALARQVAMYLVKQLTHLSYPEIGRQFHKHHSTVLYSVHKIEGERAKSPELDRTIKGFIDGFTIVPGAAAPP